MDRECDHDSALKMLMTVPRSRVETKMQKGGVNVAEVIARTLQERPSQKFGT
jgi:hypothetical protein